MLSRRGWIALSAGAAGALAIANTAIAAKPHPVPGPTPADMRDRSLISPELLRSDLTWLRETLLDVGVKPFAYVDEAEWQTRFRETLAGIATPMNRYAFYLRVAPLFAGLNDGHAGLGLGGYSVPGLMTLYTRSGGRIFPLYLRIYDGELYVDAQTVDEVPAGSRIVAIDGNSGRHIAQELIDLTGGQHPSLRAAFAGGHAASYFFAKYGARHTFATVFENPDGGRRVAHLHARNAEEIDAVYDRHLRKREPYTFSRIAGGRVGYIDYRSCEDYPRFARFLQTTFGAIKQQPVDGLVIDIRRNGGGASDLNNLLWSYVTDKPFAQFGSTLVKATARLRREYGFMEYSSIYGGDITGAFRIWFSPDGTLIRYTSELETPEKNALRYHGPVYLLIGTGTFSSALSCALAARDFGLATIIGQETGEPANSTGEVYATFAPYTKVSGFFTTKYFMAPKPHRDREGVIPDVTIVPTAGDLRDGRDPVLAYAVAHATRLARMS